MTSQAVSRGQRLTSASLRNALCAPQGKERVELHLGIGRPAALLEASVGRKEADTDNHEDEQGHDKPALPCDRPDTNAELLRSKPRSLPIRCLSLRASGLLPLRWVIAGSLRDRHRLPQGAGGRAGAPRAAKRSATVMMAATTVGASRVQIFVFATWLSLRHWQDGAAVDQMIGRLVR